MVAKSRKHARKVTLDAAVSNAIAKAVDARKVAAFTVGAAGVLAGAAFAFGATPAMAAENGAATNSALVPVEANKKTGVEAEDKEENKEQISTNKDSEQKTEAKKQTDNNTLDKSGKTNLEKKLANKTNASTLSVAKTDATKTGATKTEGTKTEQKAVNTKVVSDKTADNVSVADKTSTDSAPVANNTTFTTSSAPAETPASTVPQGQDRAGAEHSPNEIAFSKNLPNIYGWATPSNTFDENLEKQTVVYHLPKSVDGKPVVRVVILPDSKDSINTDDPEAYKKIIEFDSERVDDMHQSYSGIYELKTNPDGSVDLIMKQPFRDGRISSGQGYCANRSIFLYYDKTNLQHDQTSNNFRVATLVPPKTAGSIVLKYDERLSADKVREVLHKAVNLPTEHKSGSSVAEQLVAQSKSTGVGLRVDENTVNNTPDTVDAKIPQSMGSYDEGMFEAINKKDSNDDYSFGERKLKTYLVTDLGMKSPEIPLTVVRYSTRIEKPVVDTVDFSKLTEDQKTQIKKNLAKLNGVSTDKVTFDNNGTATIDFDGLSTQDDPKIPLSDLVLTRVATDKVAIPSDSESSKVKAVVVANPLGYSQAELRQIKKAIYEANKDNQELGLSAKDYEKQISLGWIEGNLQNSGKNNQGISNGQSENTITVTIRTDKAYAQFKSDIKKHQLTRLIDLRKDYTLSWEDGKNKIKDRDTDEGLAWSEDKKTIIYRYDPDKGEQINTQAVLDLLKATVKSDVKADNPQLRDNLLGTEITTVKREGLKGQTTRSHRSYTVDDKGEPIGVLNLVKLNGGGYGGFAKPVDNSDKKMGDEQSSVNKFTFDTESKAVEVAGKNGKCMIGRLFIEPYSLYYYNYVYGENKYNLRNTPKGINVVFVPQTKNKKDNLSKSIGEHKLADDQKTPTESKYYNASADKKDAYDKALAAAKETLEKVGTKADADLSEDLKAEVDNATINLKKAREALDGDATKKEELNKSIKANGKAAEGDTAATPGTVTTDKYKNVTEPDFKDDNGNADTTKNEDAKKAKEAYDKALEEANKVNKDGNATQKAVDDAKAKLDAARKELDKYSTNKDELNNAIAQHGKVYTGDADKQDEAKLKTADPTYQNSTPEQRKAYDDAVKKANELSADPNASQKDVNKAIEDLKKAKEALDKNATDKAPLDAAVQKSFDNPKPDDKSKQSVFYKNAAAKKDTDPDAKKAVEDYDKALQKAKDVLGDKNATKADVEKAKKDLEDAEAALHADKYQTKVTDLAEAIADNVSGYLMPAYFNAFDEAQAKGKDSQAAKDFKAYNDAYHAAKDLITEIRKPNSTVTQDQADKVKKQLIEARKAIDKYATDTSKISAALLHSLAITTSPAYKNASANTDPNSDEAKAKAAYDTALEKLQKAFNDEMPQDTVDGKPGSAAISTDNVPVKGGDTNSASYLDGIQSHAKGQPLNRDVTKLLAKLNDAVAGLDKFKTNTDDLIKSINEDDNTKQTPAYKNTKDPDYKGEDGTTADTNKNSEASAAKTAYDDALDAAKGLLKKPDATQKEINDAKTALDNARKELDKYNTDVAKLKESVDKNGKDAEGSDPAVEGTKDSDAYRNASDPHFLNDQGKPDTKKNNDAKKAKADYDKALAEAQELLSKHDDANTPLDAKPTQKQIDKALTTLDTARKTLEDTYKTNTDALSAEAAKSKADTAQTVGENDFENTPEFKNADAKKKDGDSGKKVDNDDVAAYRKALKDARDLLSKKDSATLSDRPTQKQIDDALETLKNAKKQIEDNYKTDTSKLEEAKKYANGDFKKTPEYKNATAIKNDNTNAKHEQAGKDLEGTDQNPGLSKLVEKIATKLQDTSKLTQKEVDDALEALQKAMDKVTDGYKTDVDPLQKEVGDKTQDDKPVTPPFEESIPYKNALYKKQSETGDAATGKDSATKKLETYNEKFKAAQDLINKVKNPDSNADPDKKPTNADVKKALDDLQKAKKAIDDAFTTSAKDLKDESAKSTADGATTVGKDDFENTTEFKNAESKKGKDGKDNADVTAYKEALSKARTLLGKFDENGKPKSGEKDIPTQQEVDEALKKLKDIKDKITADYKTSSTELQQEVDKSKDGDKDKRDDVFENTPAFKNATAKGDDASKKALEDYNKKLQDAKGLLDKFDRTTGKPKDGATDVPTQKELYDALDALQAAKKKIEDDYSTIKYDLRKEADNDGDFTKSPEYQNAQAKGDDAAKKALDEYQKALDEANSVLDDPNATQSEVDEALKKLQAAKAKLRDENGTDKSQLQTEADDDAKFRKSLYFIIGNKDDIEAYNTALAEANSVLKDPNATQAQVDEALRKLKAAKYKINHPFGVGSGVGSGSGYDTDADAGDGFDTADSQSASVDKSALQLEVNNSEADSSAASKANTDAARAYVSALAEAKRVLADKNATQAQVDAALRKLQAAKAAWRNASGASGNASGLAKTGAATGLFASLAAVFSGLGVAGVASRRRKHSNE